jgi:hypothetical protein
MTSFGKALSYETISAPHTDCVLFTVFVTGNANKLKEVQAILQKGNAPISVTSQNVDSMYPSIRLHKSS